MRDTFHFEDAELGVCEVCRVPGARGIRLRACDGRLRASMPEISPASLRRLAQLIDDNRERLRGYVAAAHERYARAGFYEGRVIPFHDTVIKVTESPAVGRGNARLHAVGTGYELLYNPADDLSRPAFRQGLSRMLLRFAADRARVLLPPQVAAVAEACGVHPAGVCIGRGRRTLGHCSSRGVITLSAYVMFLPAHLRRYIICHELAHLTHFDHSRAFHVLCDAYCGGNEKAWRRELLKTEFPIVV